MGKINSRSKGCRGEREWAHFLTDHNFPAYRGQQYKGGPTSPDVICNELNYLHFEVKRTEKLSLYKAMQQAIKDSDFPQIPIVAHRRNNQDWLVIMRAEEFLNLVRMEKASLL